MVQQNAKKLGIKFGARVETDIYEEYFKRRLKGEKLQLSPSLEFPFLQANDINYKPDIAVTIESWYKNQLPPLYTDLIKQQERLKKAEETLSQRITKKAENEIRIASTKINVINHKIEKYL